MGRLVGVTILMLILSSAIWADDSATATSVSGGSNAPAITLIQNNYSYTVPGLPNYGIAPGSIFIVQGSNLSNQPLTALQSSAAPGLPLTLNGTGVSVTVGGVTTQPPLYYTSPGQLAAVLPSTTPVGTGTITVVNNGQPSAAAQIQVVQSAFGIDTVSGTGAGQAVAENSGFALFTPTSSAQPGQPIIIWGSGIGADTANDDKLYPQNQDNLYPTIPMQVYIGGVSAPIVYAGRSQYPGLDQIVVNIPSTVAPGCGVSLVIAAGDVPISSNFTSIPISPTGGACADANSPFSAVNLQSLLGQSTVNYGGLQAGQITTVSSSGALTTTTYAEGIFYRYTQTQFVNVVAKMPSIGSCVVVPPSISISPNDGLDAGSSISLTGPLGSAALLENPGAIGYYAPSALANGFLPSSGGNFAFAGTGGADVAAFNADFNVTPPLTWTNSGSVSHINRANGVTVTWSGGSPNSYAWIEGISYGTFVGAQSSVLFACIAPVSPGTFTVPGYVTASLPAGTAGGSLSPTLTVGIITDPTTFSASGLDVGFANAAVLETINVTYQ